MITTEFTKLVGCTAPVQMAGMGGMTPAPMVAAVATAGGLGMMAGVMMPPEALSAELDQIRSQTTGKVGVNFLMPFLENECVRVAAEKSDVVEFFYDTPRADLVRRVHDAGSLACWQIGSPDEARQAIDAGCELIVAQGVEAGGHVRGTMPLLVLLDRVLEFASVPVVAAGAVSTSRGMAAALAAGASAIRVGTRFVAAVESAAHPDYADNLLRARSDDTVLTTAYSDMWPNAPHRVLKSCVSAAERHADDSVGTILTEGVERPLPKFNVVPPDATAKGNIAAMCQYAGQSVETITKRDRAADIVHDLVTGAERLLARAHAGVVATEGG